MHCVTETNVLIHFKINDPVPVANSVGPDKTSRNTVGNVLLRLASPILKKTIRLDPDQIAP